MVNETGCEKVESVHLDVFFVDLHFVGDVGHSSYESLLVLLLLTQHLLEGRQRLHVCVLDVRLLLCRGSRVTQGGYCMKGGREVG